MSADIPAPSDPANSPDQQITAELTKTWQDPPGFIGAFKALQNDTLGVRIMATAFALFLLGGINALLIRLQLAQPAGEILGPQEFNQAFTMHGSTMMFLFAVPFLEGFAILLLPYLLGNREMPFPRLGVFSFWTFLFGGILFYSSYLFNSVPDAGWFAYVPLSSEAFSPGRALDFWLLALGTAEVGAIAAGVEIIIAVVRMRAPGMSIARMPLYAWAMLVTAIMILFAFTPLFVGTLLLELDRQFGTAFFNPDAGGSPVLWQHLFWIFGHPEVYIQFIPAAGMVSMIVPVFARHRISGYTYLAMALVAVGFVSFGLWVHHMFTVGLPVVALTFFAAASTLIAIPSGVQIVAWVSTIWQGRPVWKTPFLFVIGFMIIFVLGGITGVMVASVPFDWQVHDSYFVVAHFHYVLIGGVTFPIFAAIYYWTPKFLERMFNETLGKLHFWLFFIGFNVTFFPQHIVGLLGMPRRVYTYQAGSGWEIYNLISTIGAFIIAASVIVFLYNLVKTLTSGEKATANPWDADSLEWSTPTPAPPHGFTVLPIVRSRHPLWDQDNLVEGQDKTQRLVQALGRWPVNWRAALVTSPLDGEPQEIFRVAGPSIWPFVAAIGLTIIFASEIFRLHWLALVGALVIVISLAGWHWPEDAPTSEEEELAFEREYGIPVRSNGSWAVSRWAMALLILIAAIALATFLVSYFYIRIISPDWPPPGISIPQPFLLGIATLLLVLGGVAMRWGFAGLRNGSQSRLRIGLGLAALLGAGALGVMIVELGNLGIDWSLNAYASIFMTMAGFMLIVLVGCLIMNLLTQFWAWRGAYTARRNAAVANSVLLWYAVIAFWVVTFGVLYFVPRLG
jgi:cytochrome c oxidase subunit I+III